MSGILFDKIIFGPVNSRRLGKSLGINLLPENLKVCSMNCIYCECGWGKNIENASSKLLPYKDISPVLRERFQQLHQDQVEIDSITYSGNGEPTMHPQFKKINKLIIKLRDIYFPKTIITCLSNSTQFHRRSIIPALRLIDNPLMKLDAGTQATFYLINKPFQKISLDKLCENLRYFDGELSIQTLFLRGRLNNGKIVDNTSEEEVEAWLKRIKNINPRKVILYSIDRETPAKYLEKIDENTLNKIALQVRSLGIQAEVY
jgi:wyosine [tRNA(Phe)-imidazoG37] synthetase (radical SAM superfamily)